MSVTTRVVTIWACIILLSMPLAWVAFNDISLVVQHIEILVAIVLILSLAVSGWMMKRRLKKRMQQGLGRAVDDNELMSITAWIRIPKEAEPAAREAEKYDFGS